MLFVLFCFFVCCILLPFYGFKCLWRHFESSCATQIKLPLPIASLWLKWWCGFSLEPSIKKVILNIVSISIPMWSHWVNCLKLFVLFCPPFGVWTKSLLSIVTQEVKIFCLPFHPSTSHRNRNGFHCHLSFALAWATWEKIWPHMSHTVAIFGPLSAQQWLRWNFHELCWGLGFLQKRQEK